MKVCVILYGSMNNEQDYPHEPEPQRSCPKSIKAMIQPEREQTQHRSLNAIYYSLSLQYQLRNHYSLSLQYQLRNQDQCQITDTT